MKRDGFTRVILGFAAVGEVGLALLAYASGAWKAQIVGWVTAGITYMTGLLVWYYLVETSRIRIATERQSYPFVVLRYDLEEVELLLAGPGAAIEWPTIFAVNLGGGPAVHIQIDGLQIPGLDPDTIRTRLPAMSAAPHGVTRVVQDQSLSLESLHGMRVTVKCTDPSQSRVFAWTWIGDRDFSDGFRLEA